MYIMLNRMFMDRMVCSSWWIQGSPELFNVIRIMGAAIRRGWQQQLMTSLWIRMECVLVRRASKNLVLRVILPLGEISCDDKYCYQCDVISSETWIWNQDHVTLDSLSKDANGFLSPGRLSVISSAVLLKIVLSNLNAQFVFSIWVISCGQRLRI